MIKEHLPIRLAPLDPGSLTEAEVRHIRILRTIGPHMSEIALGAAEGVLQRMAEQGKLAWPQQGRLQLVINNKN